MLDWVMLQNMLVLFHLHRVMTVSYLQGLITTAKN